MHPERSPCGSDMPTGAGGASFVCPFGKPGPTASGSADLARGPWRYFPQTAHGPQRSPRWVEDPSPWNPHPPAGEWTEHTKIWSGRHEESLYHRTGREDL